jgi:hypothetical protein
MRLHGDPVNLQRFESLALEQRRSYGFDLRPARGDDALGLAQQALKACFIDQSSRAQIWRRA